MKSKTKQQLMHLPLHGDDVEEDEDDDDNDEKNHGDGEDDDDEEKEDEGGKEAGLDNVNNEMEDDALQISDYSKAEQRQSYKQNSECRQQEDSSNNSGGGDSDEKCRKQKRRRELEGER